MKNIRDIREEKNLYFLLPEDIRIQNFVDFTDTAIIICLYYENDCQKYLNYVDRIPPEIPVYIVSSNERVYPFVSQYILNRPDKRIELIKKKNRCRDISALLVACREIALRYEYICFAHDKKGKSYIPKVEHVQWLENLWGNTLGSSSYIANVLHVLKTDKAIGLLTPPEPIGGVLTAWYDSTWADDFELTRQLIEQLGLTCDLDKTKPSITLGTFFWAKSAAIRKLLEKDWKYEDFDEEPLKDDGTISHAIERVFGYVAQDAGYETGTVMCISYAQKLLSYSQKYFSFSYKLLKREYGIENLETFYTWEERIRAYCRSKEKIYLYGAGIVGKRWLHILESQGCKPDGFLVTDINSASGHTLEGIPIKRIDEIDDIEAAAIIITVSKRFLPEIEQELHNRGIVEYMVLS